MKRACALVSTFSGVAALAPQEKLEQEVALLKWSEFQKTFGREYTTAEEKARRHAVFMQNLKRIAALQVDEAHSSAHYSHLSPFADWEQSEFDAYNRLQISEAGLRSHAEKASSLLLDERDSLPDSYDWRTTGAVGPVKDQGQCGSCWSFSTIANVEGAYWLTSKKYESLSEQEVIDCDPVDHGCDGGLPENADDFLIDKKEGLERTADYPYTAEQGDCQADPTREKVWVGSLVHVGTNEDQIARALMKYGPLSLGINATPMQWYTGGVSQPLVSLCDPDGLNHAVNFVGFGAESPEEKAALQAKQ
eukprot:gene121-39_t